MITHYVELGGPRKGKDIGILVIILVVVYVVLSDFQGDWSRVRRMATSRL
jgi:hypothetical protein